MTLKNAINMIENLRNCEIKAVKIFTDDPLDENSSAGDIGKRMARISQGKVDYLDNILLEIKSVKIQKLAKKCRHPKKDQDVTSTGQRYCMNCNADL